MTNKYCMCIVNQPSNESLGFMPTPKSMLKSVGLDLNSVELGFRKMKKIAIPVVSIGALIWIGNKGYKMTKRGE